MYLLLVIMLMLMLAQIFMLLTSVIYYKTELCKYNYTMYNLKNIKLCVFFGANVQLIHLIYDYLTSNERYKTADSIKNTPYSTYLIFHILTFICILIFSWL